MNSIRIGLASTILAFSGCSTFCPPPPPVITPKPVVIEKPVVTDTSCNWVFPITIDSTKDILTPETSTEILTHNKAGVEHCGWKPKAKAPAVK